MEKRRIEMTTEELEEAIERAEPVMYLAYDYAKTERDRSRLPAFDHSDSTSRHACGGLDNLQEVEVDPVGCGAGQSPCFECRGDGYWSEVSDPTVPGRAGMRGMQRHRQSVHLDMTRDAQPAG